MKNLLTWAIKKHGGKRPLVAFLSEIFDRNYAEVTLNRWIKGTESTPRHVGEYLRIKFIYEFYPEIAADLIHDLDL